MRTSRRSLGLNPEFEPEPTPPASDNSDEFINDFQIETTIEENERTAREDEEERQNNLKNKIGSDKEEIEYIKQIKSKSKDIISSSDDSEDESSSMSLVLEETKLSKSS